MSKKILLVIGPTASGKTDLTIKIAHNRNFEVINGDAMQVYKEIPIITAQPTKEEIGSTSHHLFGYKHGHESYSVAHWLEDAKGMIEAIHARGKIPIVVGGSGLYFKALTDGITEIPSISEEIRHQTRKLFAELGNTAFFCELKYIDPEAAKKIKPGDSQRMMRAFEIMKHTGKSITQWHKDQQDKAQEMKYQFLQIQVDVPRQILHAKINTRFNNMIQNGALEEASLVMKKYFGQILPINKAHGIPELIKYLQGHHSLEEAIEKAQIATRQYAKRQTTWIKHQTDHLNKITYHDAKNLEDILKNIDIFLNSAS
jgi:tRNA dimethylallyltransferase